MEPLVLNWVANKTAFELMPGLNRLGRNPTNDFRIADRSVSSFHCEVTLEANGTIRVRDLASTNGTFIEHLQLAEGELKVGQTLGLGSVELQLERATIANPALIPEVVLVGGGDQGESWKDADKPQGFFGKLTQTLKLTRNKQ